MLQTLQLVKKCALYSKPERSSFSLHEILQGIKVGCNDNDRLLFRRKQGLTGPKILSLIKSVELLSH